MSRQTDAGFDRSRGPRLYLLVPYAEKEEAKAAGARWCPVMRQWWIQQSAIGGSPELYRWIDDDVLAARARDAHEYLKGLRIAPGAHVVGLGPAESGACARMLPQCTCVTPPWESCEHTTSPVPQVRTSTRGQTQPTASTGKRTS